MTEPILSVTPLQFVWGTADPFLFCVHHDDAYPAGNDAMGPAASLAGRRIGQDFEGIDGWRMYHGDVVPGFPQHPHRGFETVTLVRRGLIDHADSMGARGRFGGGDAQWMTAGRGVQHSEMFPLLKSDADNPVELFQIWLNLPRRNKMVEPHYAMLWSEEVPHLAFTDDAGRGTVVTLIAGELDGRRPPPPPPSSWASEPDSDVAIWTIKMEPGAHWIVPPAQPGTNRTLYPFDGPVRVAGTDVASGNGVAVHPEVPIVLEAGPEGTELVLLQGRPIGEPVVQYGPFVMNTPEEIQQAFADYQRTQFGGWPWDRTDPVNDRAEGRFAAHADGRQERPA
ncbi:MAG: pirin family protein [Proteobacteria bacterium]|nr:pirin family protein [Pseudomonadota bacterium]